MKGTRSALRYARAILDLAKDRKIADEVFHDMILIDQTISENPDLQHLIASPVAKSGIKSTVLTKIFGTKTNALTMDLVQLMIRNNRINLLQLVAKEYQIIYDFLLGNEVARVTTAVPLTKELEAKILEKIKTITKNTVSVENIIDPAIIGGFILRIGDKQYDSSVTGMLNSVLDEFEENHYIAKL